MKFSKTLPLLFEEFGRERIDFALVGGLALYALGTSRTTFDADFMILLNQADIAAQVMERLGYKPLHRTDDIANYVSEDADKGQVDFVFAHRRYALSMLRRATTAQLLNHPVKVLLPEDLIGLKVQSSSNDPNRALQDMADIEALMQRHRKSLDWSMVESYFKLFGRETEYKDLRSRLK